MWNSLITYEFLFFQSDSRHDHHPPMIIHSIDYTDFISNSKLFSVRFLIFLRNSHRFSLSFHRDMSRDEYRGVASQLTRSTSHDNISINPLSKFVHSKPTSHGAGQRAFAARDDNSSSDYVVSSPYENASSAIAVSFFIDPFPVKPFPLVFIGA